MGSHKKLLREVFLLSTHNIWVATWETVSSDMCDQWRLKSACVSAIWSVFIVCMKKLCILGYPKKLKENSDQTAWMCMWYESLLGVHLKVCFLMLPAMLFFFFKMYQFNAPLTHYIRNRLSHTIYWKSPISILGTPGYEIYIFLDKND